MQTAENLDRNTILIGDINLPGIDWKSLTYHSRRKMFLETVQEEDQMVSGGGLRVELQAIILLPFEGVQQWPHPFCPGNEETGAKGGSEPKAYENESGTGRGKDRCRSGHALPRLRAERGSCYVDGSTLGRSTSGPPGMEDLRDGDGGDLQWVPSWSAATGKPSGWRARAATPTGSQDACPRTWNHQGEGKWGPPNSDWADCRY